MTITGTEKQITWATEIRETQIAALTNEGFGADDIALVARQQDARFWIETRNFNAGDLVHTVKHGAPMMDARTEARFARKLASGETVSEIVGYTVNA